MPYELRDTAKVPPTKAELDALIGSRPLLDFLNAKSRPFRARGLDPDAIDKAEAVRLILEDVNFLKRPIVTKGRTYVSGIDEAAYRKL